MIIIAGLGNPGDRYEKTRHNVGFQILDQLASRWHVNIKTKKFKSLIAELDVFGEKVLLVKPQTFMNESGHALREVLDFYKLSLEHLLVVFDDLALPLGQIRFVSKGSSGGHNGLKSISAHCGGLDFNRLKVGIGHPGTKEAVVGYVLSAFAKTEEKLHDEIVHRACLAIEAFLQNGLQVAMNQFNGSIT